MLQTNRQNKLGVNELELFMSSICVIPSSEGEYKHGVRFMEEKAEKQLLFPVCMFPPDNDL